MIRFKKKKDIIAINLSKGINLSKAVKTSSFSGSGQATTLRLDEETLKRGSGSGETCRGSAQVRILL